MPELGIRIDGIIKLKIDLLDVNNNTIYEVKPVTYRSGYRLLAAVDQLDNYVCHSEYTAGTVAPFEGIRTITLEYWEIKYWYEGQGIILYVFYPQKFSLPNELPVTNEATNLAPSFNSFSSGNDKRGCGFGQALITGAFIVAGCGLLRCIFEPHNSFARP